MKLSFYRHQSIQHGKHRSHRLESSARQCSSVEYETFLLEFKSVIDFDVRYIDSRFTVGRSSGKKRSITRFWEAVRGNGKYGNVVGESSYPFFLGGGEIGWEFEEPSGGDSGAPARTTAKVTQTKYVSTETKTARARLSGYPPSSFPFGRR